jgi:hypothetical protein
MIVAGTAGVGCMALGLLGWHIGSTAQSAKRAPRRS